MEIADVRRRVRGAIENARKESVERRERSDGAAKAYTLFLERQAVPTFRLVAVALTGEGLRFNVSTPAESVRLSSEGNAEDYLELALDSSQDPPAVMGRTSRGRGRRAFTSRAPGARRGGGRRTDRRRRPRVPRRRNRHAGRALTAFRLRIAPANRIAAMSAAENPRSFRRIDSVCCPSTGGALRTLPGVSDSFAGSPRTGTEPRVACSTRSIICRDAICGSCSTSPTSRTAPQGTPAALSASIHSARVRVLQPPGDDRHDLIVGVHTLRVRRVHAGLHRAPRDRTRGRTPATASRCRRPRRSCRRWRRTSRRARSSGAGCPSSPVHGPVAK